LFNERLLKGKGFDTGRSAPVLSKEDLKNRPPCTSYEFDKDYFERLRKKLEAGGQLSDEESRFLLF
jgi:hypothetical protein